MFTLRDYHLLLSRSSGSTVNAKQVATKMLPYLDKKKHSNKFLPLNRITSAESPLSVTHLWQQARISIYLLCYCVYINMLVIIIIRLFCSFLIDNVLAMRNLPCLGVAGGSGLGGIGGKAAATAAMEAAADATTAPQPPHSTSSYFTTTYYHLTDDECMSLFQSLSSYFHIPRSCKPYFFITEAFFSKNSII